MSRFSRPKGAIINRVPLQCYPNLFWMTGHVGDESTSNSREPIELISERQLQRQWSCCYLIRKENNNNNNNKNKPSNKEQNQNCN